MHVDLATALMIFGLVTFAKIKLHPPSFKMRNAIHRVMTCLIIVPNVCKLGGNKLGEIKRRHVVMRWQPTCIVGNL